MAYGHTERNLDLIRRLDAQTGQLLDGLAQLDPQQWARLQGTASQGE
jgi:hypothetical protein